MITIVDRDLGLRHIERELRKLDGKEISAGILRDAGNYDKGQSIADVAIWNEYGTSRIPSRPFVRIASDENRKAWENLSVKCVNKIISGSGTADETGNTIGQRMKEDIKKVIGDKSKLAPNAPSTIKKKGHDKPLIDTGKLKATVNYRVEG